MAFRRSSILVWIIILVILLLTAFPFVQAASTGGEEHVFGGFLLNPIDGNTYLAKMFQGWRGDWLYNFPYTAEKGQGAYLFLLYLFLGHLSRLIGASQIVVFHIARLLAAIAMLLALHRFCRAVLPEPPQANLATLIAAIGSGVGWLALPFGGFTSDFWVAEAYPFLSAYANPHFPLSMVLLLWILTPPKASPDSASSGYLSNFLKQWYIGVFALLLAMVSPFGVVLALVVLGGVLIWEWLDRKSRSRISTLFARLLWIILLGLPLLVYDVYISATDPLIRAWNAQNQTPSPPAWDLFLSFSPLLILAVLGIWQKMRHSDSNYPDSWQGWRIPAVWSALALILLLLPVNLQRRFIMGFYVPLAVLAVPGLFWLSAGSTRRYRMLAVLLFFLILPTNLVVLLAGRHGVQTLDPQLYLHRDEIRSFEWLRQNAPPEAVVLASPQTGLFIPAYTGLRVIYGHPFETVNAESEQQSVLDFFSGRLEPAEMQAFMDQRGVSFVVYGPRERSLGDLPALPDLIPVYRTEQVIVYAFTPVPAAVFRDVLTQIVRWSGE